MRRIKIKVILLLLSYLAPAGVFSSYTLAQEQKEKSPDTEEDARFKKSVPYDADKFRDPFKTPLKTETVTPETEASNTPEVSPPNLEIQGIFWGGDFAHAIINNTIVKAGDMIGGAKIISIEKDNITVFYVNKQFVFSSPASENLKKLFPERQKGGN